MTAVVLAFITVAACGTVMMIRVEQLERGTTPPAIADAGNAQTLAIRGRGSDQNEDMDIARLHRTNYQRAISEQATLLLNR